MEFFWKDSFVPLVKHVERVSFVDWIYMTAEDWDILDYPNLRPAARAALEKAIDNCDCSGFYRVEYDMHKSHSGKRRYYYPAKDDSYANLEGDEAIKRFGNFEAESYDRNVESPQGFQKKYQKASQKTERELIDTAKSHGVVNPYRWPPWALILFAAWAGSCAVQKLDEPLYETYEGDNGTTNA
jgi:hypothetical protein